MPVSLYARDSVTEAPTFELEKVGERTYVISGNGYKTQDQDGLLVGSIEGEAQRWYIEYAERHDAYIITKENERIVGWIAPADDGERQIRVGPLIVGRSVPPYYPSNELFRFKYFD